MAYKALYRTHRPSNFDEVVGQDHIVSTLKNMIANDKIGHAYLFAGPRGTGKTSVAHVFARAVNANSMGQEVFGEMDILEIDAASNNGVSEVRTIIDNVNYAPTKAKYKVYIIDEVHMLTKGAFNALLKTLEEPPAHVLFILATTEPHKIPITILSRTQRFNFRRIDNEIIGKQLVNVLQKENINIDKESIKFISKLAQGGMRDALSIADQASAFGNGTVSFEAISQVFGIISVTNQIRIFNLAYAGKAQELMKLINQILNNGADIERLSSSLLDVVKDYIVVAKTSDKSLLSFITEDEIDAIDIDVNYAYELVEILIKLTTDLRFTSVPRQSFELAILKMVRGDTAKVVEDKPQTFTQEIKNEATAEINIFGEDGIDKTQPVEVKHDLDFGIVEEEQEEIGIMEDVENDILSTQEIPVGELNIAEETSEINILELFETDNSTPETKVVTATKYSVGDILNLFVQAKRDDITEAKLNWAKADGYRNDSKFKHFSDLITSSKVISAGENFVLISSNDKFIIDGLNTESTNDKFNKFIALLFGTPVKVFAISKDEFNVVKEEWKRLSETNELPSAKRVSAPALIEEPKTEAEELGSELFGSLFSA